MKKQKEENSKVIIQNNTNDNEVDSLKKEIEQLKEEIKNMTIAHKDEMKNLINDKDLLFKEKLGLENKISKMKSSIMDLTNKFEAEISNKEKKVKLVNENNSKLFNDLQAKNKNYNTEIKNMQNVVNSLKKEKYDLETIVLMQEEKIKQYQKNYPKKEILRRNKNVSSSQKIITTTNIKPPILKKNYSHYKSNITESNFDDFSLPIIHN